MDKIGQSKQKNAAENNKNILKKFNSQVNFIVYVEVCEQNLQEDNHTARLAFLRESLKIIQRSKWQYDPIDKLIGQS